MSPLAKKRKTTAKTPMPPPAKKRKSTATTPMPPPAKKTKTPMPPPAKKTKSTATTPMPPPAKKTKTTAETPKKRKTTAKTPMPPPAKKTKITATTPMSPPAKKTKTTATTLSSILSLPHDLLLSCLARISRLYYPTLSLVSKSFRSLLASPELYKVRSLLGHTESCLYVCFWCYSEYRWFTLCRKPDENLTNDTSKKVKSSGYVLARVPIPPSPRAYFSGLVAVGSSIYNLAESGSLVSTSFSFSILDCRSHTWSEAPGLRVNLMSFSASVLDRKIYVAECCKDGNTNSLKNSIQVFDTETRTWDPEPIPCSETNGDNYDKTACINGKFHLVTSPDKRVVAYNSKEGKWDVVEQGGFGKEGMGHFMRSDSYCEIENVLYSASASDGAFRWYDSEVSKWRKLEGLVGLPKFPRGACVRLANYGGKMAVLWDKRLPYYENMIWCAEIALEKRKSCEIWGKVEWFDHVLRVPSCELVKVLAVTV